MIFKSDPNSFTNLQVIPDSLNVIVSLASSNESSFAGIKPIVVSLIFSTTIPIASLVAPSNLSPMIKSSVDWVGPENSENSILLTSGSAVLSDSKIPKISITSGLIREISLSCTLVPYG